MAKIVVFRGDAVEQEVHLAGQTIRIGRDGANEIVLDDKSVSRFHAEIRAEAGTFSIVDLKSRNGVWVSGQQVKKKGMLALGVPVTLGAYELVLEDDVLSGEFEDGAPPPNQGTLVNAPALDQTDRPSRSATRAWSASGPAAAPPKRPSPSQSQVRLWSGIAIAVLLIGGATYAAIRYSSRPDPVVAVADPPPVSPEPAPALPTTTVPADNPNTEAIAQHLAAARTAIQARDYAGAVRDHLSPVLAIDSTNQDALALKRQADEAIAAAAAQPRKTPPVAVVAKTEPPAAKEVETQGIPRKPGEVWADYTVRVTRIQTNFQEGNRSLEKPDFPTAIAKFQSVERDQKGYRGVDALIADATARQQRAVDEALDSGLKNEQAQKWADALRWYQYALGFDPASTKAREKVAALGERLGLAAFEDAEVWRKRGDVTRATVSYRQAVELLPPGHEKSRQAQKYLEPAKP